MFSVLQGKSQSGLEKLNYKLAYYTVVIINITACGPSKFNRAVTVRARGQGFSFIHQTRLLQLTLTKNTVSTVH